MQERRTATLTLQGRQTVLLRELEEKLLSELSSVKGDILDDDRVIEALERLKGEAAQVNEERQKTLEVMDEVLAITATYQPLASDCAAVFFASDH